MVAVEDVISWLDRFARRYRGMRQPVEGLPGLLAGIGARLRAEGVPSRALPALRMPDPQASSRDRCLDLGAVVAARALTGNGVFGLRRGRWATGSPFTPPPGGRRAHGSAEADGHSGPGRPWVTNP
ncbi:hypothetical protein ACPB9J_11630 [Streptomyces lavendulocolor]|uniref:hypothetical protein n=1 Tax=Streptomyces lavendulocolor TaxID=67316 RepID=UPI003C2D8D10